MDTAKYTKWPPWDKLTFQLRGGGEGYSFVFSGNMCKHNFFLRGDYFGKGKYYGPYYYVISNIHYFQRLSF